MATELSIQKVTAGTLLGTDAILAATFEQPGNIIDDDSIKRRDELIETSQNVEQVVSDTTQQMAADQLKAVQAMISQTEKDRKASKKPFDDIGKKITVEAREFSAPLETEKRRLQTMLSAYHDEQLRKQRDEERKARERQAEIERQKQEALAKQQQAMKEAKSVADVANATAEAELAVSRLEKEQEAVKVSHATTATGTAASQEWLFEVEDLKKVFEKYGEELLDIRPKAGEIKRRLKAGEKLEGIKAWQETKVRASGR